MFGFDLWILVTVIEVQGYHVLAKTAGKKYVVIMERSSGSSFSHTDTELSKAAGRQTDRQTKRTSMQGTYRHDKGTDTRTDWMSSRARDTSCVQTCRHVHKRNSRSGGKVVVDVVVVDCVVVVVVSESKKRNCYNRNIFGGHQACHSPLNTETFAD